METFEQIGTVEVLRLRMVPLDATSDATSPGIRIIVEPGRYPLYSDGFSHLWVMSGRIDGNSIRRGDGLFALTGGDNPIDVWVQAPSRVFGPDEFKELLDDPLATEGHADQRLRITINERT